MRSVGCNVFLHKLLSFACIMSFIMMGTGCAGIPGMSKAFGGHNIGEFSQEDVEAFIVKGKTTQDEVKSKFGTPSNIVEHATGSTWEYSTAQQNVQATGTTARITDAVALGSMVTGASSTAITAATGAAAVLPAAVATSSGETQLNISFDRARIVEDYNWYRTSN